MKHTNIAKTYKRIYHGNFSLVFTILIKVLSLINKINIDISKLHILLNIKISIRKENDTTPFLKGKIFYTGII